MPLLHYYHYHHLCDEHVFTSLLLFIITSHIHSSLFQFAHFDKKKKKIFWADFFRSLSSRILLSLSLSPKTNSTFFLLLLLSILNFCLSEIRIIHLSWSWKKTSSKKRNEKHKHCFCFGFLFWKKTKFSCLCVCVFIDPRWTFFFLLSKFCVCLPHHCFFSCFSVFWFLIRIPDFFFFRSFILSSLSISEQLKKSFLSVIFGSQEFAHTHTFISLSLLLIWFNIDWFLLPNSKITLFYFSNVIL